MPPAKEATHGQHAGHSTKDCTAGHGLSVDNGIRVTLGNEGAVLDRTHSMQDTALMTGLGKQDDV